MMPDPRQAPDHGLLAGGGDLEPGTVLAAYRQGIFPWPDPDGRLLWWSPDPRAVLPLEGFHESRSLGRIRRQGRFRITRNAAFSAVIRSCGVGRGETWITPEIVAAYERLHQMGWVHSVEAWAGDVLAGGVYGVAVGGLFAAESMFHHVRDASKVALAALVDELTAAGFALLDVQLRTDHLASLGVIEIPRDVYLERAATAIVLRTAWS